VKTSADRDVARMFDRISPTYDRLNRMLSLGVDQRWRILAVRRLHLAPGERLLDCGAGTGDMALEAFRLQPEVEAVLVDPAPAMLRLADSKAGIIPPSSYRLVCAAAESLPFADASFDAFVVAFGIRNFADLERGLSELCRILKTDGRAAVVEFTPDRSQWINRIFRWYMSHVMIPLGARISRDADAYSYLTRTVENFATSQDLRRIFEKVGLECREIRRLSFGIAHLFVLGKRS
jgi:demethylmenaquinone methyltransferase/2-methoxy-6-polyprenyl-1,4-benzoquinol methylase